MTEVSILAIDLAKRSFQVCAAASDGYVISNRVMTRGQLEKLLLNSAPCLVAMEACGSSHHWGRFARAAGHEVKLIPPIYVKPFVKRVKNDAADAAAIATAVRQPDMRFVEIKDQEQQARGLVFRAHQTLTRQRVQLFHTIRGHLHEHGIVIAQGNAALLRFEDELEAHPVAVPDLVLETIRLFYHHVQQLNESIATLERQMAELTQQDETACRIQTIPGVGRVNAAAFMAFAPPMESFQKGRDFAAWLGLVPKQHSTGGKPRLGRISKMGQSDMRRLLVVGATACVRWAKRKGVDPNSWLGRLIARKPAKLVAVAVANKLARMIWAVTVRKENYNGQLLQYV